MPTLEQNREYWNADYAWEKQGDEWSETWGGARAQWFGSLLPRVQAFLPTGTILEIAPGFGRWTNYLKDLAKNLIVVDLSEKCIQACQNRFIADRNITYHANDGRSLSMIPDNSIDFVFSFDSLVHAENDVLKTYLEQLAKKLRPDGCGFIHHSNIGEYRRDFAFAEKIHPRLKGFLTNRGAIDTHHWRAFSMTASLFERYCDEAGLQCIGQELVNWSSKRLIDSFSFFTPKTSKWARPNVVIANPNFMREAERIKSFSYLY